MYLCVCVYACTGTGIPNLRVKQICGAGSGIRIGNFTGKSKRGEGKYIFVCVCMYACTGTGIPNLRVKQIRGAGSGIRIGNFTGKPKRGEGKYIFVCVCVCVYGNWDSKLKGTNLRCRERDTNREFMGKSEKGGRESVCVCVEM